MSASEERLRVLREHKSRDWTGYNPANARQGRIIGWLIDKGWMETHPDAFLSQVRITDLGYDVLAQAGGDVTGTGW